VSRAALVAFVVLVGATLAAFVVAQRLKGAAPVVRLQGARGPFSPNGDHVKDVKRFALAVRQADSLTIDVVDEGGGEVRRLAQGVSGRPGRPVPLRWDGRADDGTVVPDGRYRVRVTLARTGRTVIAPRSLRVDTRPPRPYVRAVAPGRIAAPREPVTFTLGGISRARPTEIAVWRTDVRPARRVATGSLAPGTRQWRWDDASDAPGVYMAQVERTDRAGNTGRVPAHVPTPAPVPGAPGVTIRALAAQPPVGPVTSGDRVSVDVDSRKRPYTWRLTRVGGGPAVAHGRHTGTPLTFRAPAGASGLYVLRLRSGSAGTRVPLLVQAQQKAKLLVVVPELTWLGRAPVDDRGDGQADTLDRGGPVDWPRVLPALPRGFRSDVAPLLAFLDEQHVRYDLTSDLALALDGGPRATDRRAVLLAGGERWITPDLARRLRRYVSDGGRLATIATDSMRRGVTLLSRAGGSSGQLVRPTPPVPRDPFGARLLGVRQLPSGAALQPIAGNATAPLLSYWDGTLSSFGAAEESLAPQPGDGLQVGAAVGVAPGTAGMPDDPRPAITQDALGKGTIIRIGVRGWVPRLTSDVDVVQLTRNAIDVLLGATPKPRELAPPEPRHARHHRHRRGASGRRRARRG
jgi:hypothetical protein